MRVPEGFAIKNAEMKPSNKDITMFFDKSEEEIVEKVHCETENESLKWKHTIKAYYRLEYCATMGRVDLVCERKQLSRPLDHVLEEEFNLKAYHNDKEIFCSSRFESKDHVETLSEKGDENLKQLFWLIEGKYEDRQRLYSKDGKG